VLVATYIVAGTFFLLARLRHPPQGLPISTEHRDTWRMPALSLLARPKWSRGRLTGMYLLRGYLVVAVILLLVKAVELGTHK
jgi:hypothetical protein